MLEELLNHVHNWFPVAKYCGGFTIKNGGISLPFLKNGQYFRIKGSTFNDGLHQHPVSGLIDEMFTGEIWALAIPKAVQEKAKEIEQWKAKNPNSALTSESFDGYSYSRATDENGGTITWQTQFKNDLNRWRKISDD